MLYDRNRTKAKSTKSAKTINTVKQILLIFKMVNV